MEPTPAPHLTRSVLSALPDLASLPWLPLTGGRTNRVWRVGLTVVKAYDRHAASPLFPNDAAAEAAALTLLGPSGLAPVPRGSGPGWVAYDYLPGGPWQIGPAPVATVLHRLHRKSGHGFRPLASGSRALRDQAGLIAALCAGPVPPAPQTVEVPPAAHPGLIHGDAVAGNIIVAPDGTTTLIDWQCPACGDPCEDLALFLSPAMQWLYRGAVLSAEERTAFLAAYPDHAVTARYRALAPLFAWRMAAHCLWKAENGAPDYRTALLHEVGE